MTKGLKYKLSIIQLVRKAEKNTEKVGEKR